MTTNQWTHWTMYGLGFIAGMLFGFILVMVISHISL